MESEVLEKYLEAGRILKKVREEAVKMVEPGVSLLETAEYIENLIRENGGEPAFPCNISRDSEAAHATPSPHDKTVFQQEMVKLDIGVHVDGYIADTAVTIDLGDNQGLVTAVEKALEAAIAVVRDGVDTGEIGRVIEEAIRREGYKPIVNLTGHGLSRYLQHAPPSIPNRGGMRGVKLKEGDVIAIEPFATNGSGRVYDAGNPEIYHLLKVKPVRLPAARRILEEIEKYKTLPFARRWLPSNPDFALTQLTRAKIIEPYPVLKEAGGGLISQAEHTLIVNKSGCTVTTA